MKLGKIVAEQRKGDAVRKGCWENQNGPKTEDEDGEEKSMKRWRAWCERNE